MQSILDIIELNSVGGTSHGSGNPPANHSFPVLTQYDLSCRLVANGVSCSDLSQATTLINRYGYTRLMVYVRSLRKIYGYHLSIHLLSSAVLCDIKFKCLLHRYLTDFERNLKEVFASSLAAEYEPYAHLEQCAFSNSRNYAIFLKHCEQSLSQQKKKFEGFVC